MTHLLLLGWLTLAGCPWISGDAGPTPIEVTVVRGDTLFKIAQAHEVTVDELRQWNGIEGDLIEVGQILTVFPSSDAPEPPPTRRRARTSAPAHPSVAPPGPTLTLPDAKPCLEGPSLQGMGDDAMAASEGLSESEVRTAMNGFVHHTLTCIGEHNPTGPLELEIVVGCDGQVDAVHVQDASDWPQDVHSCVRDVLRYTPFPAHGLPDGDRFTYPLRYTAP